MYKAETIAHLAQEFELSDPFDWGLLAIREEDAFLMIAQNVCDIVNASGPEDQQLVCMVAMTKLLVENFVLNLQLAGITDID